MLGGNAVVQLALAAISAELTLAAARALGFSPRGSILAVLALAVIASQASIGIGLLVASLARSQHRAFLVASVTMFVLLLFSGVIFPRPEVTLVTVGGAPIGPFDLLPTTHLHEAMSRVLAGAALADVAGRVAALFALSALYFAAGVLVFRRRHALGRTA